MAIEMTTTENYICSSIKFFIYTYIFVYIFILHKLLLYSYSVNL